MCAVIGHSVIAVSKSLLLCETSSIPVGLHIAAETTSIPVSLSVSVQGREKRGQRDAHREREEDGCGSGYKCVKFKAQIDDVDLRSREI